MMRRCLVTVAVALTLAFGGPNAASAQNQLQVRAGNQTIRLEIGRQRGYASVVASALGQLGWRFRTQGDDWIGSLQGQGEMRLRPGRPFVQIAGEWVQLTDAPFLFGEDLHLPVQLLIDVWPDRMPDVFRAEGARTLRLLNEELVNTGFSAPTAPIQETPVSTVPAAQAAPRQKRVVVIDAGHGGVDPGAIGPSGTREKDVALALALELARELGSDPTLEVHLTRNTDVLVPLWQRGEIATRIKGDRPGIFISIHANALPASRQVRGYETYFLSEARTEHEARVAALENSAVELESRSGPRGGDPELGSILNELRNLDYQHWSSELASRVQREVMSIHPGRDRGVKQAPLAVLTNALMPGILIEAGFITNPEEERLLRDVVFQRDTAREIAQAVRDFFQRYPPGATGTGAASR